MTNQDLINKLSKFPLNKEIVFFCNEDVVGQDIKWNECYMENIEECLYIEYIDRIFTSLTQIEDYLYDIVGIEDVDYINEIVKEITKKEIIRIDLNI
jgi:hypothetical protein